MATRSFGVGLIGVEPNRSWAAKAHIPALKVMPERFHVAGIANSSAESGRKAAEAMGVERAFSNSEGLIASSDVDIVAVTVKVPNHYDLVAEALKAGKHVYCEWPLGKDLDEALRLHQLAVQSGVHGVIGTQALRAPVIRYAKDLIAQGYVGDVLSITSVGTGGNWGAEMSLANAYCLDLSNGASMLSIPVGHMLAAVEDIFGAVETVSAEFAIRRKTVRIAETGEERLTTVPDQVLIAGLLKGGVPLSVHYRGGSSAGTGLLLEINGTEGNLQITGPMGHLQMAPLTLNGGQGASAPLQTLTVPEEYAPWGNLQGPPANVAAIYADLYADLTEGTHRAPDFADAVRIHRLLAAIEAAATSGTRQTVKDDRSV